MYKLSVRGASRRALRAVSIPSRGLSSARQSPALAFANAPYFAEMNATLAKRKFDPTKILPSGPGEVRVLNNTTRDAQQSNLSAEMADEHRQIIGDMINDCYKGIQGAPGYEQTWGGTIMMFDLWKRGVQPFEECRVMCSKMPDTPASALIRSNALNAMAQQPKDVVDSFIKCAAGAGVNVFTNFDAHNDWRNHVNVAEAVHKYGGHYQAALSYAVWREDPTIYNVQWAVDFFRELMPLNPHSLYVKDPSGVLTPEMAGALAAELKAAFPDKPLVFHTHYQTGFGYMSYWEAVRNGANGVECSLGFADGAGQPYGLTLLRAFEEMGYKTGNPNKDAWQKIYEYSQTIKPLYAQTKNWRVPDIMVELNGIAGGQRTILDAELRNIGMGNRIKDIDTEVQKTRAQGGKVCQVTPAADNYAREAMRRLKGGDPAKGFVPGYASMLTGDAGKVPEPVDPAQQKQALVEKATGVINNLVKTGGVQPNAFDMLVKQQGVVALVEQLQAFSAASTIRGRLAEVTSRIAQLGRIKQNPVSLERLNLKIQVANYTTPSGVAIRNVDDRIKVLKEEVASLEKALKAALPISDEDYVSILKRQPSAKLYQQLLESSPAPIKAALQAKEISKEAHLELMASAGFVTCAPIELLPLAMESARKELKSIDEEHVLGLCEDPVHAEENAVIHAMYKAAPMFSLLQFFKNYRENPANWPALFEGHVRRSGAAPPAPKSGAVLRGVHRIVANFAGSAVGQLEELQKKILATTNRIRLQDASPQGTAIKAKLEKQLAALSAEYKALEKATLAKIESQVAAHPGLIGGTIPAYTASGQTATTVQSQKEEIELARKLWADLMNKFTLP